MGKEWKKNTWSTQKIIHMEFNDDDDVEEQSKNANDVKAEGKVRARKKQYTITNLVVKKRKESTVTQKIQENPRWPRESKPK